MAPPSPQISKNNLPVLHLSITTILYRVETHAQSKLVSLAKTKAIKQSVGLGAIESMEHASAEGGRMKRSLGHMNLEAGILITPAQSLCFK